MSSIVNWAKTIPINDRTQVLVSQSLQGTINNLYQQIWYPNQVVFDDPLLCATEGTQSLIGNSIPMSFIDHTHNSINISSFVGRRVTKFMKGA